MEYPEYDSKIVTVPQDNIIIPTDISEIKRGSELIVVANLKNDEFIQVNGKALTGKFFPSKQTLKNLSCWPASNLPINKLSHEVIRQKEEMEVENDNNDDFEDHSKV